MPTFLDQMIERAYRSAPSPASLEKTAEEQLTSALRKEEQIPEARYGDLSDEQLAALFAQLTNQGTVEPVVEQEPEVPEPEKIASAEVTETPTEEGPSQEVLEKVAMDTVGGMVMAHAMVHEFGQIKLAMAQGLCRICKEKQMDLKGSSVCSACQQAG